MPRPPDGAEPRTAVVPVRFTPTGLRYLDAARGRQPRSKYIRRLVSEDVARRQIRPKEQ
jgi:hypothetical protein